MTEDTYSSWYLSPLVEAGLIKGVEVVRRQQRRPAVDLVLMRQTHGQLLATARLLADAVEDLSAVAGFVERRVNNWDTLTKDVAR